MNQFRAVIMRFTKGAAAGAATQIALVTLQQPKTWLEFSPMLNNLGIAVTFGALVGLILAIEKWASWEDVPSL